MDLVLIRSYLKLAPSQDADAVLRDAIVVQEPGALHLLNFVLQLRVNRRTRRTRARVNAAYNQMPHPRWLSVVRDKLFNMYRLCLNRIAA